MTVDGDDEKGFNYGERPKEDANIIKCNGADMTAFSGLVGVNITARRLRYGNRFER